MSKLYHEDFLKMFRDSPNYVHFDDTWRWEIPLPVDFKIPEMEDAPNIEGIVRKSEEAPTSISTDPYIWKSEKEIHEEKFWGSRQHCSYCDYIPCRCKNEDYGK